MQDISMEVVTAIEGSLDSSADVSQRCLGHPSSKTMEMLQFSDFSKFGFNSKTYDICIRAKQTHDSFSTSINKTSFAFELIHCDLWGPYRSKSLCGST